MEILVYKIQPEIMKSKIITRFNSLRVSSFDAVKRIKSIPPELFDDDYQFVSFHVQSLFSNVTVKKTTSF